MTKHHSDSGEERSKRERDKWEREVDEVYGCCWQCRYPALPLLLSSPPLWPTPLLQSHGSGLHHNTAGRGPKAAQQLASLFVLQNIQCDNNPHAQSMQSILHQAGAGDCCHLLLLCDILSSSAPYHCLHFYYTHATDSHIHTQDLIQHKCCPLKCYERSIC